MHNLRILVGDSHLLVFSFGNMQFIVCYAYASRTLASNCVTLFPGRSYMKSAHTRFTQPGPERQGTLKLPEIFKLALLRLRDCLSERTIQKRLEREISSWSFVCLPSSFSVGFSTFLGAEEEEEEEEKDLKTNGLASEFPSPSLLSSFFQQEREFESPSATGVRHCADASPISSNLPL